MGRPSPTVKELLESFTDGPGCSWSKTLRRRLSAGYKDPAQTVPPIRHRETLLSELAPTRRTVLTGAAALAAVGFVPGAAAAQGPGPKTRPTATITVLGTTDLHGNVMNWDYFANRDYRDSAGNDIGLAKVSTLVSAIREERGAANVMLIDAGDTIQGTPLAYYYARIDPITDGASVHPMAEAMNIIGYDAAALGNHEFNYGIDTLRVFQEQLDFPLLGANAVDAATKLPAFPPYFIKSFTMPDGKVVKVGVLGLTNPGIAIWDKANVEGRMEFPGLVEQAKIFVPRLRKAGADIVVVSAHSGADTSSSYGDALPYPENAPPWSRSRCPASTRSSSATPTRRSWSAGSPTRPPVSRSCSRSLSSGACGCR